MQTPDATLMHINFPLLFAEASLWALLMGAGGMRKWLAAPVTMIVVSAIHLGQIGTDLYFTGTPEAYAWLAFFAVVVVVPSWILASIGSSIGGFLGQWIISLFEREEGELVDKAPDGAAQLANQEK